jgi:hypothetical protein
MLTVDTIIACEWVDLFPRTGCGSTARMLQRCIELMELAAASQRR